MRIFCSLALLLLIMTTPTVAEEEHRGLTNVRDFGAKCNGFNDDTSAFDKAIKAAPFGGIVFVPPGKCVVSNTLVINSRNPVSIVGDGVGSQIFQTANKTLLQLQNVDALMIKNLFLGSAAVAPGTALIELDDSHHNRIDNITMLGGYYGLHLYGSLLNTVIDLRSGVNFSQMFFAQNSVSQNQYWVFAERDPANQISANANSFIAPSLEGGVNGIWLVDTHGEGSLYIHGGTIEGVSGTGLTLNGATLPSTITGLHFEANKVADVVIQAGNNIRISGIVSNMPINILGDSRNVQISDSLAQTVFIDLGNGAYPLGTGAKRIILYNITACWAANKLDITPAPTLDPNFGMPNGPSSPAIINTQDGQPRMDIIYTNIGKYCGGG